jgi:iron complex outermembrane recepter protein
MRQKTLKLFTGIILLLASTRVGWTQSDDDLRTLSIEDLLNVEVTTVSRVPTTRSMVPAAVHVISQDEIRRTGAKSLPDVLRLIPGIQVAQIDSNKWAIGIRGFSDRLARSML